jgi:hypothetical protein
MSSFRTAARATSAALLTVAFLVAAASRASAHPGHGVNERSEALPHPLHHLVDPLIAGAVIGLATGVLLCVVALRRTSPRRAVAEQPTDVVEAGR